FLARSTVDASPGLLEHPVARLGVEVGEIAKGAGRQEVAFDVLHSRLDDALLLRIARRASLDLEPIAFGTLGVRALHERIKATGAHDGALGVVDDHPLWH